MKRAGSLILTAGLCLSLCACGELQEQTNETTYPSYNSSGITRPNSSSGVGSSNPTQPNTNSGNQTTKPDNGNNQNVKPENKDQNGFASVEEYLTFYAKMLSGAVSKDEIKKMFTQAASSTLPAYAGVSMDEIYSQYLSYSQNSRNELVSVYGSNFTVLCTLNSYNKKAIQPNELSQEDKEYIEAFYGVGYEEIELYEITFSIRVNEVLEDGNATAVLVKIGNKWYTAT